mmetsp:Transcript_12468/g.19625  ORF Transcript_12468/g.19625 Transcript_12468/m.19625 type:complete len:242 (-) Transcript_12468:936-1661(-)
MGQGQSTEREAEEPQAFGMPMCDCISESRMQATAQSRGRQGPPDQAPPDNLNSSDHPPRPSPEASCGMTQASPLHLASAKGDVPAVQAMIRQGYFSVDCRDNIGRTPMMMAAIYGQLGVAKALLDLGAMLEVEDSYGRRALIFAMEERNWHVADWIKWHAWDTDKRSTPLIVAGDKETRRGFKSPQVAGTPNSSFKGAVSRVSNDGLPERSPRVLRNAPSSPDEVGGQQVGWNREKKLMTF